MSTFRYRWVGGVSSDQLDQIIESGSGSSRSLLFRAPFEEVTLVDDTREPDLDDFMAELGFVPDATGPTVVVSAGPYSIGTEFNVLVDASGGPITVTLPLTGTRPGNDVLVMKTDSSSNTVTVSRSGADTVDGVVTQLLTMQGDSVLLVADGAAANWEISSSRRGSDITFNNSGTPTITADNVQDAINDIIVQDLTSVEVFTAGEALSVGDVLTFNSSGEVIRANSSIAGGEWEVIGVSKESVLLGSSVQVFTKSGSLPNTRFGVAPPAIQNGNLVFLDSTSGQATVTPPVTSGNTLFTIGTLQGADGVSMTPIVHFRPQFIAQRR